MKNNVKDLRQARILTQQQLADLVQVSRQMISAIEKGVKKPNIILALKLADVLGVPIERIFKLDEAD